MYRKNRKAIDDRGRAVVVIERKEEADDLRADGSVRFCSPIKFFAPDGQRLLEAGDGTMRTPLGQSYRLVE